MRQIILNLGGNAIKFTDVGEVTITSKVKDRTKDLVALHFSVSDSGIGIAKEKQDAIFRSFEQADGSTTRKYGGTGLGLTISKQLVEMMEGRIWVESPYQKHGMRCPGSAFQFIALFKIQKTKNIPEGPTEKVDLNHKRILIVDDNDTDRMILKNTLSNWGIRHDDVPDGDSAIRMMTKAATRDQSYDLVLMDDQLPDRDGFETSSIIKDNPKLSSAIIVMVTSMGLRGDAARCKAAGIDGYLIKPVKQSDLFDAIAMALGEPGKHPRGETTTFVTKHAIRETRRCPVLKILLAEDNEINQKMAMHMLQKYGHKVSVADNGKRAMELLDNQPFDLVLMDVQMPVMDGLTATRSIRNMSSQVRDIPIIAMTAHAMKGDREKCLEAGMTDYISKPFDPQELSDLINRCSAHLGKS